MDSNNVESPNAGVDTSANQTFSACGVARYILDWYNSEPEAYMSITKLIKLTYISHGFALGLLHRPLFKDKIEAWKYGPVIRTLYAQFKTEEEKGKEWNDMLHAKENEAEEIRESAFAPCIDKVIAVYGDMSPTELTGITHKEGTPWHAAAANGELHIDNSLIEGYYEEKLDV